ncbi:hypothetical protein MARPO_0058s0072 [Marchantia polymorpha]|uniref:OBG-type G domain-containing protein n=1 Tax=Marchantia polymorpha TaxID=3197 RepID=A0A2R6WTU5_MARPO|nr:hypothetical protein MARPO_0058s0072 [Marchantia polymorpha]|eukprot:PTQ37288.1 hypothetical protein MARPO_0058s0072 [Marchantia polymorpha]
MTGGCGVLRRLVNRFYADPIGSFDRGVKLWVGQQDAIARTGIRYHESLAAVASPSCAHSFLLHRGFASDDGGGGKKKKKKTPLQERKMIDKFRVHVRGGDGGAGCTSFRKSRQARYGAADGGNGGRGGDVILVSSAAVWDFSNLQHHMNGGRGGPGSSKKKVGSRGADKVVQVPVGTVVHLLRGSIPSLEQHAAEEPAWDEWESGTISAGQKHTAVFDPTPHARSDTIIARDEDEDEVSSIEDEDTEPVPAQSKSADSNETGMADEDLVDSDLEEEEEEEEEDSDEDERGPMYIQSSIAEFVGVGESLALAFGGEGGKGNASIARGRGAEKALPSLSHEQGKPGSEADLILELKSIADVGLVGAPNAGKSTLLGSMSRAKPVTGHYKFTTLRPNIGKLQFEDRYSFTVADIPGLIEGAHENRGLGHNFLRHIERTKVLAYVVDLSAGIGENPGPLPWDQIQELEFELEQYQEGLSKRPSLIVANKIDEEGAQEALEELKRRLPEREVYAVCAVLEEGVDALKKALRALVEKSEPEAPSLSDIREL